MNTTHPTYRILNNPITILGASRKVLVMGAMVVLVVFALTKSVIASLGIFAAVCFVGRVHAKDATTLPLLMRRLSPHRFKKVYEPKLGQAWFVSFHD